jgi:hypothetical protein
MDWPGIKIGSPLGFVPSKEPGLSKNVSDFRYVPYATINNQYRANYDDPLGVNDRAHHWVVQPKKSRNDAPLILSYGYNFFNNIHVIPEVINVGNVYRDESFEFYIYCSYRTTTTIPEIITERLDGLSFDPNILEMTAFKPLREYLIVLNVSSDGPTNIDGRVTDIIDKTNRTFPVRIQIIGIRAILIGAEPNWLEPVVERLEWMTEVNTTYDGTEIRRALRQVPRRYLEYTARITLHQLQRIENLIYTFFDYAFVVPIWTNVCHIAQPTYETDDYIIVDNTPIVEPLNVFVIWERYDSYIICETIERVGNRLNLRYPLGVEYPVGTKVFPVTNGRLTQNVTMASYSSQARDIQLKFLLEQKDYLPKAPPPDKFKDIEILTQQPNWREALNGSWDSEQKIMDNNYGKVAVIPHGRNNKRRGFTWLLKNYGEVKQLYQLLDRLRGRQKRIYIPTFNMDFYLEKPYITGQTSITVTQNNFEIMGIDEDHRYIMLRFVGRPYLIREIISYAEQADGNVQLNLDSIIPFNFVREDLKGIHWVKLYRLAEDGIEIAWRSAGVAEVDTPFVERKP